MVEKLANPTKPPVKDGTVPRNQAKETWGKSKRDELGDDWNWFLCSLYPFSGRTASYRCNAQPPRRRENGC
eukprot:3573898-Amphidinium_carterae.1